MHNDAGDPRNAVLAINRAFGLDVDTGKLHPRAARDGSKRKQQAALNGGKEQMLRTPFITRPFIFSWRRAE
jgi:hypothetical protein